MIRQKASVSAMLLLALGNVIWVDAFVPHPSTRTRPIVGHQVSSPSLDHGDSKTFYRETFTVLSVSLTPDGDPTSPSSPDDDSSMAKTMSAVTDSDTQEQNPMGDEMRAIITGSLLMFYAWLLYSVASFVLGGVHDVATGAASAVGSGVAQGAGDALGALGSAAWQGASAVAGVVGHAAFEGAKVAAPVVGKAVVGASQAVTEAATPYVQEASKQLGEAAAPLVQEATNQVDATILTPMKEAVDATLVVPIQDAASELSNSISNAVDVTITKPIEGATDSVTTAIDQTIVQPVKGVLPFDVF